MTVCDYDSAQRVSEGSLIVLLGLPLARPQNALPIKRLATRSAHFGG